MKRLAGYDHASFREAFQDGAGFGLPPGTMIFATVQRDMGRYIQAEIPMFQVEITDQVREKQVVGWDVAADESDYVYQNSKELLARAIRAEKVSNGIVVEYEARLRELAIARQEVVDSLKSARDGTLYDENLKLRRQLKVTENASRQIGVAQEFAAAAERESRNLLALLVDERASLVRVESTVRQALDQRDRDGATGWQKASMYGALVSMFKGEAR